MRKLKRRGSTDQCLLTQLVSFLMPFMKRLVLIRKAHLAGYNYCELYYCCVFYVIEIMMWFLGSSLAWASPAVVDRLVLSSLENQHLSLTCKLSQKNSPFIPLQSRLLNLQKRGYKYLLAFSSRFLQHSVVYAFFYRNGQNLF